MIVIYLFIYYFYSRCVLAAPYLACLKGENSLAILFLMDLFDANAQPQSITSNNIFGVGAQGPFHLESVPGDESVLSIFAEGDDRKRILIPSEVPKTISRDIVGDAKLFITTIDNEKVVLETTYGDGVRLISIYYPIIPNYY